MSVFSIGDQVRDKRTGELLGQVVRRTGESFLYVRDGDKHGLFVEVKDVERVPPTSSNWFSGGASVASIHLSGDEATVKDGIYTWHVPATYADILRVEVSPVDTHPDDPVVVEAVADPRFDVAAGYIL